MKGLETKRGLTIHHRDDAKLFLSQIKKLSTLEFTVQRTLERNGIPTSARNAQNLLKQFSETPELKEAVGEMYGPLVDFLTEASLLASRLTEEEKIRKGLEASPEQSAADEYFIDL